MSEGSTSTLLRKRHRYESGFTILDNRLAQAVGVLSLRAIGLGTYLWSLPDGPLPSSDDLADECKEGRDAIRTAANELVAAGFMRRSRESYGRGKWRTVVELADEPVFAGRAEDGLSGVGGSGVGGPGAKNVKDSVQRTNTPPTPPLRGGSARDSLSEEHRAMVDRIFEAWRATDPDRHKHRGKPTTQDQRKIMARLRDGMSEADIILAVTAWPFDDWDERKRADRHTINVLLMNEAKAIEWAELGRQHEADTRRRLDRDKPVDWEFYARQAERLRLEQGAGLGDLESAPHSEVSEADTVGTLLAGAFGGIE
jgi:hypothetical protein